MKLDIVGSIVTGRNGWIERSTEFLEVLFLSSVTYTFSWVMLDQVTYSVKSVKKETQAPTRKMQRWDMP